MPIILANAYSHEFTYTDEGGTQRTVRVQQGQALPGGIPADKMAKLLSQHVVRDDRTVPKYTHVDEVGGATYTQGSTMAANVGLAENKKPDPDAMAEALAAAEAAIAAETTARMDEVETAPVETVAAPVETVAAPVVATPEVEVDPEAAEKAELFAALEQAGEKAHPATGITKLREKVAALTPEHDPED